MTGVTYDGKRGVRTGAVKMIHLWLSNFWLETLHDCERLLLNGQTWASWPLEETNSAQGQRRGWITQSFCVMKFY